MKRMGIFLIFSFLIFCSFTLKIYSKDINQETKTIHIFVALCDNKYQGIVKVPEKIGNGQDPENNLYWGCAYGIKTYFKRSKEWKLIKSEKLNSVILERVVFKHMTEKDTYIIADAYDGRYIKECTKNFLSASSGMEKDIIELNGKTIGIGGNAGLISYIGHNGFMDFNIRNKYVNKDKKKRDIIILACYSKLYFSKHLNSANVNPLIWTTGRVAPEAYTIHEAVNGYLKKEDNEKIRERGAEAYSKYQKCSKKAARNLLVTGW